MAIIGAHQMRLRSAAHSSYVLNSLYWHGRILALAFSVAISTAEKPNRPVMRPKGISGAI